MFYRLLCCMLFALAPLSAHAQAEPACRGGSLDVSARYLMGGQDNLCEAYAGSVVLLVNTASQCGFAGQLEGLQALQARYEDAGFTVIGVPSADFGGQEFDEAERTAEFCRVNYGVTFPMLARSVVRGTDTHPLFRKLYEAGAGPPEWNFHKYLLDREGNYVADFGTRTAPEDAAIREAIEAALSR